jgi:hypothetical protein
MTTGMTATPTATRPAGSIRRNGLVAVMVAGPLAITVLRAILPYSTTDDAATILTKVAEHQAAERAVSWLTLIAMVTLVPGVIALGLLAARRSPRLGTAGMVLAVAGFSCLAAVATVDFTALAAMDSGIDRGDATLLLDSLNTDAVLTAGVAVFALGHIVGVILLGVALLRGRAVPAWAAWALIVSQPLHLVFAVIIPSNALDAAAWALTTVGFAAAAVTLHRQSSTMPATT